MLFNSPTFVVFLRRRVRALLAAARADAAERAAARRELGVLRRLELEVSAAADCEQRARLRLRSADRRARQAARRKRLVLIVSVDGNLLFLATFKYLGFFVDRVCGAARAAGVRCQHAGARDRVAGRHLVLHVSDDRLRRRRLSRQGAGGAQPPRLRAVRRVLPAARRGPDRTGGAPDASVSEAARLEHAGVRVGAAARVLGALQESRHCRQPRAVRRRGVCESRRRSRARR